MKKKLVWDLKYNSQKTNHELALEFNTSVRTIQRWLADIKSGSIDKVKDKKKLKGRDRQYSDDIFNRILELKRGNSSRSSPMIHHILKKENFKEIPSISSIRKYLAKNGLSEITKNSKKGYIKFERSKPNDLWQIDIAGVQTVSYLGQLYLIALIDDCSRFIVAGKYFTDQKGKNVIQVLKEAIITHGRPNQVLADNGAQFRTMLKEYDTKYTHLLKTLDIEPIFAKPYHPQTKGKLERFFQVVIKMWLSEERIRVKNNSDYTLKMLNESFNTWLEYYNTEKPHRMLKGKVPPMDIFSKTEDKIFRPLETRVNWDLWLNKKAERKVTKYNIIHYEGKQYSIPPGYSGSKIDILESTEKIDIYYKEVFLISHPYFHAVRPKGNKVNLRKISIVGLISWKGKKYSIDYKYKGLTVELRPVSSDNKLEVYYNNIKIKEIILK